MRLALTSSEMIRVIVVAASALGAGFALGRADSPDSAVVPASPPSPSPAVLPVVAPPTLGAAGTHLAEAPAPEAPAPARRPVRPLFRPQLRPPERRAAVPVSPPRRPSRPPAARPTAPPPEKVVEPEALLTPPIEEEPELALVGVFELGDQRQAVLEETERGLTASLAEGETAFGVTLERIESGQVVVRREDETETLVLGESKPAPKVEFLADPTGLLRDPLNAPLRTLPPAVTASLARVLPRRGILKRVRASGSGGRRYYRVEKTIDGLNYEARIAEDGTVLRTFRQIRAEDVPERVLQAANQAREGFQVNASDVPTLWDRDGRRFYQIEIRQTGGREEVDLWISPNGELIGRG